MPGLPIERSIAHPSLLAEIVVSKYADHQPLYRQSEIAARDGVTSRSGHHGPLGRAMRRTLRLLTEALRRYTMAPASSTRTTRPIPVLAPGNRKTKTGRLWVYVRDDRPLGFDRTCCGLVRVLAGPQRHSSPDPSCRIRGHPAGRWLCRLRRVERKRQSSSGMLGSREEVHIQRSRATPPSDTQQLLEMIGELYGIEADIRGKPPDERLRVRQEKSKPLLATLETSMREKLATLSTKSPLRSRSTTL